MGTGIDTDAVEVDPGDDGGVDVVVAAVAASESDAPAIRTAIDR